MAGFLQNISVLLFCFQYLLGNLVVRIDSLQLGSECLGSIFVFFDNEVVANHVAVGLDDTGTLGGILLCTWLDELDELLVVGFSQSQF